MTTICAPSTTPGGAIGIIRVSGQESVSITNQIFSKDILKAQANHAVYGNIVASEEVIDDVVITIFRAPHSYTGEDTVEISHHGSKYIQETILSLLIDKGCVMANPGEFTQRAFLNGKMDLTQAEAVADLISSNSRASHRIAMQHMRGGISIKLKELRDRLLHLTSLLELELDFSDHEDLEFADRSELTALAIEIEHEIKRLSDSFTMGNALKNGIPVAIVGAPNVGKSTLLNQILGDDRAIVSDIHGTTRDIIEDTTTIDGVLYRFIDTAGIRKTDDTIEAMGIERSLKAADKAQIILLVTEPGVPYPVIKTRDDQRVIRILNKTSDFQAKAGVGMDWLRQQLSSAAITASDEDVLITNLRHKQSLDLALVSIRRSIDALNLSISGDLVAEDLRQCLSHLAAILGGEITPDDVLGNIFKHFCIGK